MDACMMHRGAQEEGWMDGYMMHAWTDGWMDTSMDGMKWMDRHMERWMDRWVDSDLWSLGYHCMFLSISVSFL